MSRVLITGATGFIGRQCLEKLFAWGYECHAVSLKAQGEDESGIHWHQANLLDPAQISELMRNVQPQYLLHLAWYVVPGKVTTALENYLWVQASLEILRQFKENGGQRVVMAGSCFEYDWRRGYCSELLTPKMPSSFYGHCKHALQGLLQAYADQVGLSSAWGRIFFLYGPREHPSRLVSSVIISILKGEPARCTHGKQIRDYLYVNDVAEASVMLLVSDVTGPVNIASGNPVRLKDIVYKIADKLGSNKLIQLGAIPCAADESPLVVADVRRLWYEVGWKPKYNLDRGLEETISWWKKESKEGRIS